jgi:hypothetical protein
MAKSLRTVLLKFKYIYFCIFSGGSTCRRMFEYRERGREVRAAFCTNSKFIAACYMLVRSCVGLCVRNGVVGRGRGQGVQED